MTSKKKKIEEQTEEQTEEQIGNTKESAIKCEVCGKPLKASGFDWAQVIILPLDCPTAGCMGSIEDYEYEIDEKKKLHCSCPLCKEEIDYQIKRKRIGGNVQYGWRGNGKFCSQKCAAESIFE